MNTASPSERARTRCVLCRLPARAAVCSACVTLLPFNRAACHRCALPVPAAYARRTARPLCTACRRRTPPFERTLAPLLYLPPVDALVRRVKFGPDRVLAAALGAWLAEGSPPAAVDVVVAVPLPGARWRSRGFNQAAVLAKALARRAGVPCLAGCCRRIAGGPPQSALPAERRRANVRGAFVVPGSVRGLRVALVDDVVTTGATVAEIASVLTRAGAASVEVHALARAAGAQVKV
jgi:ComF family protein